MGDVMSIYIKLLIASFFWGSNVIVMKLLLNDIPFLMLATLRVLASFLFLGLYMLWKHISFDGTSKGRLLIIGFISIYLNFFFTFLGMNEVKGIDNAFMNALAPMLTLIFSMILLKHQATKKEYISVVFTMIAFLLSIHFQIFSIQLGFLYLFFGLVLYMLGNVLIQKWGMNHTLSLTFYQLLFGFLFLLIHCLVFNQFDIQVLFYMKWWKWVLFLVVSGIGFAYIQAIYIQSIQQIGVFETSFFLSLNPIVTYIESLIFLNESFDFLHFLSFILLGYAVYLSKKKKEI